MLPSTWNQLKESLWSSRGIWITAPTITGLVILIRFLGLLQAWEWSLFDQYMRFRPLEATDPRVAIVGIDEDDVHELGTANLSDQVYADLIKKLRVQNPRAIGLDIYRDLPENPGHEALLEVFETTPNLVGIEKVAGEQGRETVAPPPILKEKGQVGANDLVVDADGTIRRGLIYLANDEGETVYSFGLHLALRYLNEEGIAVEPREENPDIWQLGQTTFAPFSGNDGGYVRSNDQGYQLLINYRGPSQYFETVSLTDILQERVPSDWAEDRVILIGKVGESFKDLFDTPYSNGIVVSLEKVPGVEVHANLVSQIISAAVDNRFLIKSTPESVEWLWILGWAGVGAILSWRFRHQGGRGIISWQVIVSPLLATTALIGLTYFLFLQGWWFPVAPPFVAMVGSVAAITTYVARTAGDIRKTFGRYLSDSVVATLLESPEGLKLGGERREITILTSDLRGFTATSERLPPEGVVKILNLYLGYMADVITDYQGTIDEFMGDGILVLFGAPMTCPDDAQRAVACAVAMQQAMEAVNEKMAELNLPKLKMGIGINTGEVVVGNIGSEKRTKYGVVGSHVNLTYRIESYTTSGQILISESTLAAAGAAVQVNGCKEVKPKGVKEPLKIYDVAGIGEPYNLVLTQEEEVFLPLDDEIILHYSLLEGKDVKDEFYQGKLRQLSAQSALVALIPPELENIPPGLTNLKLNVLAEDYPSGKSDDIYAKVLDKPAPQPGCFYIYFTAQPPEVEARFNKIYKFLLDNKKKEEAMT
jgi:adenylate cyclase